MTTSISVTKMSLPPTNAAVVMETHESLNSHESLIPGIQGWNSSEGGACETSGTAFPCLADVLEEQVRALEDETSLCLSPPLLLSTSSTPEKEMEDSFEATSLSNEQKYAHIPALRVSTFDNVQQQKMIPVTCLSSLFCASSAHTANRGQRGQSCQQLSPSRVNVQAAYSNSIGDGNVYNPNPNPKSKQGVPLAAALYNADCVRRGKNSVASSWSGCLLSPWCTLPPTRHDPACDSACNSVAVVPGLAAYLPEELAALDLAIDAELPAKGPLPPKAAALVSEFLRENNGLLPTRPDKTSSKKQSFSMHKGDLAASINPFCDWENIDNIDLSDDSSNTGDITVLPFLRGTLTDVESGMSKSSIVDNTIVGNKDQLHEENTQHAISSVERKGGGHHVTKVDVKPELEKPEVPRNVLHPASNGKVWTSNRLAQKRKAAAAAAGGGGGGATTGGITRGGTKHRKVRKTGAQTRHKAGSQNNPLLLHEDEEGMVEGEVQGGLTVDYEIVTRKKAAAGAQKGSQRPILARRGQQWITEQAKDPRTGELLCAVPPATFCTQCGATSTPVWRAGPFGHKTLCNACGVRWMKVVPPKLKSSRT